MTQSDELDIPDPALRDPRSFEVLRVWIGNGSQHASLRTGVWEDPAAWGLMLADLVRHIVDTYKPETALDRARIWERVKLGLVTELDSPTDGRAEQ